MRCFSFSHISMSNPVSPTASPAPLDPLDPLEAATPFTERLSCCFQTCKSKAEE
ncbi:hypothetical protein KIPB_017038, partial [Kipferlia bialata]|eukprot:g17038.t1